MLTRQIDRDIVWKVTKVMKRSTYPRFICWDSSSSYHTGKVSWSWPRLKGHKGYNKVNIRSMWDIDVVAYIYRDLKGSKHPLNYDHTSKVTLTSLKGPSKSQHGTY